VGKGEFGGSLEKWQRIVESDKKSRTDWLRGGNSISRGRAGHDTIELKQRRTKKGTRKKKKKKKTETPLMDQPVMLEKIV